MKEVPTTHKSIYFIDPVEGPKGSPKGGPKGGPKDGPKSGPGSGPGRGEAQYFLCAPARNFHPAPVGRCRCGSISIGAGMRSMENYPITSLEMLSVLSNTQVLFEHLLGLTFSLWLLQRIW